MNFKESETARKLSGAYYTPPVLADFLGKWIAEGQPERVLEPSCGDGALLEPLAKRVLNLKQIVAVDISAEALATVRDRQSAGAFGGVKTNLVKSDFLEFGFEALRSGQQFDAVIGNPPFIRYQYLDKDHQERTERVFAELGLKFTKHTNAWVPFVLQSLRLLRPGGRLAMVVPAELMHVLHANSLRQYLLEECEQVAVVHLEELFSDEVLQGVVLLLCTKMQSASSARGKIAFPHARREDLMNGHASSFIANMPFKNGDQITYKWMEGLLHDDEIEAYQAARALDGVRRFDQIADVDVGIVTGANSFFLVTNSIVEEYGLSKFVEPMFGRSSHVRGVRILSGDLDKNRAEDIPANFIAFPPVPVNSLPEGARRYVALGESQSLHTRYKCRIRKPWYTVPSVWPSEIAMLKRAHDMPRLLANETRALSTDTAYRIRMLPDYVSEGPRLVWNFVNSLTGLSAELEGRHYGGGVIELVPSEIERLLIPFAPGNQGELDVLDRKFREGVALKDILTEQDALTLGALGLSTKHQATLHNAWVRLRRRRQRTSD